MDINKLLKESCFSCFSDEEKEYLSTVYLPMRKSDFSKRNILYLLAAFSSQVGRSLFDVRQQDAAGYTKFLLAKMNDGDWKEQYIVTVFSELRSFYTFCFERDIISINPFGSITVPLGAPTDINPSKLPDLIDIDKLFSTLYDYPDIYLAAALAFRMALAMNDLVGLQKEQFGIETSSGDLYLHVNRKYSRGMKESYLYVPEDLHPLLMASFRRNSSSPYLFPTKSGYMSRSGLQHALGRLQAGSGHIITFSELRGLSIFHMRICNSSPSEVALYAGMKGTWLTKYTSIPDEIRMDAAKYVNLRLVDRFHEN